MDARFQADASPRDAAHQPLDITAPDSYVNPCAPQAAPSVSGKVFAPNGVDPVALASVHVALGLLPLPDAVQCESCVVRGKFAAHVYTRPDGSFKLDRVPLGKPFWLGIQKGYFRRYLQLTVDECGGLTLSREQTTLPGRNQQYGAYDSIPRIAVVTGAWDKMEKVLAKLGVPPDEVTLYRGFNSRNSGLEIRPAQELLQNAGLMKSYHMILINCGTAIEALISSAESPIARRAIHAYVRAGGRLFVTDFSYDYVEQVFPELIDFERSDDTPAHVPEGHNDAEVGSKDLKVEAEILDPDLKAWLGLPEIQALSPGGTVLIEGFLNTWAVQKSANTTLGAKVWVRGPVRWIGGTGTRPLTTSFDFRDKDGKGCGRVVFSSYHTWGDRDELLPQERILEYMILGLGDCVNID